MFDIKDYYSNSSYKYRDIQHDIAEVDLDLTEDIDNLINNRFEKLYLQDRYKYLNHAIDIIYPRQPYPGNTSLIITPDKIRYLLSFYPKKNDFHNIEKIVLRPKFIEIGDVELVSLYIRKKKILVLYLIMPHLYAVSSTKFNRYSDFISLDFEKVNHNKVLGKKIKKDDNTEIFIHPLWYIMSLISYRNDDKIDKFFIRKNLDKSKEEILHDISFYYTRHGY